MVMMIRVTADAPRAGSMASRYSSRPTAIASADGDQRRKRQRDAGGGREHGHHAAQHDELALGEIHHVRRVVDQREAERDESIDGAYRQAGNEELKELGHMTRSRVFLVANGDCHAGLAVRPARQATHQLRPGVRLEEKAISFPGCTRVQSPPLISSMRNAERSRPRWSVADMLHDAAGADEALGLLDLVADLLRNRCRSRASWPRPE